MKIETFQDYVLPNKALNDKELDANYFQHIPYLEGKLKKMDMTSLMLAESISSRLHYIHKNIKALINFRKAQQLL